MLEDKDSSGKPEPLNVSREATKTFPGVKTAKTPWREMGLKDQEYELIVEKLGREPNYTELGMFAVLWSEHCAYKHSKALLKTLPTSGPRVLVGPGENAGVVDIGDGLAVAFKIESHNHPCAVEPYQGAATGIGGIVRDILAMGARPVCLLDSLRFGPLSHPRSRFLFSGVVSGISGYGNCLGIPTVGGEVFFAEPYKNNPLCNVLCAGILRHEDLHKGQASGPGNIVMIVGHSTGRDGIHGCTFASEELGEDAESRRPNVQVGDPFMEKLLIEACLEMMATGAVVGVQDMGAAGITSSCAETAARAGTGLSIEINKVPMREKGMTPYEVMLSESQERMLLIVKPEKVETVESIARKWGLNVAPIGVVTGSGLLEVFDNGEKVASVPVKLLTEGPVYDPPAEEPAYIRENAHFSPESIPVPETSWFNEILLELLASPNIASKEPVYRQYDYMVRTDTVEGPGRGAAVIRVKGTRKALVFSTDCNGRIVYLDPRAGAMWAVAEAARNVAVTGAQPLAITNCLNFGNPEKPDIFWQFKEAVEGMGEACRVLETPVTGGNVSFYNETEGEPVYPTPVIGMLGLIEDVEKRVTPGFKLKGDKIALLGRVWGDGRSLCGSEYLERIHGVVAGSPRQPDLGLEKALIKTLVEAAGERLLRSAQDLSEGGLGVALAESCILACPGARGAKVNLQGVCPAGYRLDAVLFGECNSAVVVSFSPDKEEALRDVCAKNGVPFSVIGEVDGDVFTVEAGAGTTVIKVTSADMTGAWANGISRSLI
ncbi:MAG: phosphoribosylformylglycinamidine synthase subunit PurL [Candidatus Fermentithermobacillus carboniphilus]|uniref:Phosphoribosylformylglycinamidine synthase subunit PurL n=1 Tax=Candidatus Fermentithermobacillus carboniphilus TaxID=3085328 RepID=A0AAT9LD30_9FIRM|nr:MAG: phosphoribosylformylglycinamidine synthase subunit PurL [Candidatus Fermentithermobacillus carboniphilus]